MIRKNVDAEQLENDQLNLTLDDRANGTDVDGRRAFQFVQNRQSIAKSAAKAKRYFESVRRLNIRNQQCNLRETGAVFNATESLSETDLGCTRLPQQPSRTRIYDPLATGKLFIFRLRSVCCISQSRSTLWTLRQSGLVCSRNFRIRTARYWGSICPVRSVQFESNDRVKQQHDTPPNTWLNATAISKTKCRERENMRRT